MKIVEIRHQIEESATFLRQLEAVSDRLRKHTGTEQNGSGCECAPELPPVPSVHLADALVETMESSDGGDIAHGATDQHAPTGV